MPRYRVVTSLDSAGGFGEFTAANDDEAWTQAQAKTYGLGRVIQLEEVIGTYSVRRLSRTDEAIMQVTCPSCGQAGSFLVTFPVTEGVRFIDGRVDRGPLSHGFAHGRVIATCAATVDGDTCDEPIPVSNFSEATLRAIHEAFGDIGQGQW